ncbi:SAG-related sequence [Besnoitia besnoiti]|uniref:SAG-related sequence n=1 Tax=Besnoitia besnoiti TaxID=94643 RepID=A0A2A9MMK9_BESBE|nr:SAG-related sequence [Besnoitia besnoiti]PFH37043.1 SAG-related sequence [Besnoitia besnoiti]
MAGLGRFRGGLKSKTRKLMAFCAGGILFVASTKTFADALDEGPLPQSSPADSTQYPTNLVSCSLTGDEEQDTLVRRTVALSEGQLSTTFQCGKADRAVPELLTEVCKPSKEGTIDACDEKPTSLTDILQTTTTVAWVKMETPTEGKGETRTLNLTKQDLPFTDKSFAVGCKTTSQPTVACQVDVTVKARASSVDKNVVTCAYGAESNPRALEAEMTEENNTLTIKCGKDGNIKPATEGGHYCEDEKLSQCEKSYKDILPSFDSSWWTKEGDAPATETLTLTIPKEEFPAEEQKFYVGCSPGEGDKTIPVSRSQEANGNVIPASRGLTDCKVLVTVKAESSVSPSRSMIQAASAASGVAATLAYLAASCF